MRARFCVCVCVCVCVCLFLCASVCHSVVDSVANFSRFSQIAMAKTSFSLFREFYGSDIIVASPLGLRMVVGSEGERKRDFDFLSSIEMLVVDQADSVLMQNWDHLAHVCEHTNLIPTASHDTDITRIRPWCLEGWARYFRQTSVLSEFASAEMNAFFNRACHNLAGKVRQGSSGVCDVQNRR